MSDTDTISVSQLIELVRDRPVLWDRQKEVYKNRKLTRKAWVDICETLIENYDELSDQEQKAIGRSVISKWANLRDNWLRYWRKRQQLLLSGSSTTTLKKYIHHDQLLFLSKVYDPECHQEVEEIQVDVDVISDPEMEISPALSSGETSQHMWSFQEEEVDKPPLTDGHIYFFQSVLPLIKDFDSEQTIDFQMAVFESIKRIRLKVVNNEFYNPPHCHITFQNQINGTNKLYKFIMQNELKSDYDFHNSYETNLDGKDKLAKEKSQSKWKIVRQKSKRITNKEEFSTDKVNMSSTQRITLHTQESFPQHTQETAHKQKFNGSSLVETVNDKCSCKNKTEENNSDIKLTPLTPETENNFKTSHDLSNLNKAICKLENISKNISISSLGNSHDRLGRYVVSLLRRCSPKNIKFVKRKLINFITNHLISSSKKFHVSVSSHKMSQRFKDYQESMRKRSKDFNSYQKEVNTSELLIEPKSTEDKSASEPYDSHQVSSHSSSEEPVSSGHILFSNHTAMVKNVSPTSSPKVKENVK